MKHWRWVLGIKCCWESASLLRRFKWSSIFLHPSPIPTPILSHQAKIITSVSILIILKWNESGEGRANSPKVYHSVSGSAVEIISTVVTVIEQSIGGKELTTLGILVILRLPYLNKLFFLCLHFIKDNAVPHLIIFKQPEQMNNLKNPWEPVTII